MNKDNLPINLPSPSSEQLAIINTLKEKNVIVDSVAGSGKTTTNLHIAKSFTNNKILLLTYNKKLKLETRDKVLQSGIKNLEVHSYHSFCVKYYKHDCYTDSGIIFITKNDSKLLKLFSYDLIILDEAQDINPLFYKLICKIIKDNQNKNIRLCILGDRYQSIYDFNNSDERFIKLADTCFNFTNQEWQSLNLSTSFRVTDSIALFINNCLLKSKRLVANKKGTPVRYIICDTFGNKMGTSLRVVDEIKYYIKQGYRYDEIFILAPSVKSEKSPIRQLANILSNNGVNIFVPNSDEENIDEEILKGKLVFSTYHQSKGLERKVVIVYNFDNSYFKFYKKNKNPNYCPNEIYVACTRASQKLTVLHHYQNDYLPFIDKFNLHKYCYVESKKLYIQEHKENKKDISVTDLVKHLPIDITMNALSFIDVIEIHNKDSIINIPIKTKQGELYESVSEITGIAIPAYFQLINTNKMTVLEHANDIDNDTSDDDEYVFVNDDDNYNNKNKQKFKLNDININKLTIDQLLYISNLWNSQKSGYIYKVNQIQYYNWLSVENLNKAVSRLSKYISKNAIYEKYMVVSDGAELCNRKLTGYIDCIDNKTIWEFKCVAKLDNDHILQLAIYMYQFYKNYPSDITKEYQFYLFNILDNNIIEIKSDINRLTQMVQLLITHKFYTPNKLSDEDFIKQINNIKKSIS